MSIQYKTTKEQIDWQRVSDILKQAGLSDHPAKEQEIIFKNSYAVVFAYDADKLIGVARALSDGVCQGAIYNVALDEDYRGQEIGREIINRLLAQLKGQNVILYTHPQTVAMYEKFGFRRNKTALSYFDIPKEKLGWMEQEGFFLPEKYRFVDEYHRKDMQR